MHVSFNGPKMYLAPGIIDNAERKVEVVSVSSYRDCVPTFGVMTSEGAFYADIPPSHLAKSSGARVASLGELCYRECPSETVWGGAIDRFRTVGVARLFGRDKRPLCMASYLLSLDWYRDNWMCHVFIAEDGPFAGRLMAWPHYRVLWGEAAPQVLPAGYQKVRQIWRLGA